MWQSGVPINRKKKKKNSQRRRISNKFKICSDPYYACFKNPNYRLPAWIVIYPHYLTVTNMQLHTVQMQIFELFVK
jgi:hypothetical protein